MRTELWEAVKSLPLNAGFGKVCEVTTLRLFRGTRNGLKTVTVELSDAGPHGDPGNRYQCKATSGPSRFADGKPASSILGALLSVPWDQVDN